MKYVVIDGNESDGISITKCTKEESYKLIEQRFEDEEYLGLYKFNSRESHTIVITDDENQIAKYRNVLSVDEFLEKYALKVNLDVKTYFTLVWIGEIEFAHGSEHYEDYTDEDGQSWSSAAPDFKWWTKKKRDFEILKG